jgi:uncharacterized membrane protein
MGKPIQGDLENSDGKLFERLSIEYQKAQDSAQHHDSVSWTMTSVFYAANFVLVGLRWQVDTKQSLPLIVPILGAGFAILTVLFNHQFRLVKKLKYFRCKAIESVLKFRQHIEFEPIAPSQTYIHNGIAITLFLYWFYELGTGIEPNSPLHFAFGLLVALCISTGLGVLFGSKTFRNK